MTVKKRVVNQTMVFVFKLINRMLPQYLGSKVERYTNIHGGSHEMWQISHIDSPGSPIWTLGPSEQTMQTCRAYLSDASSGLSLVVFSSMECGRDGWITSILIWRCIRRSKTCPISRVYVDGRLQPGTQHPVELLLTGPCHKILKVSRRSSSDRGNNSKPLVRWLSTNCQLFSPCGYI